MSNLVGLALSLVTALASVVPEARGAAADPRPSAATLGGTVTDTAGAPLPDVRVTVIEAGRTARTDSAGRYRLTGLGGGSYSVSFARLGLAPAVRRVTLGDSAAALDIVLRPSRVELAAVQVTATTVATTALTSPQPTTVLEGASLATAQAASVGETLQGLPGVRSLSMTTGIGKPVIRGLTSNRVVVLADGQRLENQQWGSDHSPNVETVAAERIEVIRGPASVLYGSDALGGVINVIARPLPDAIGQAPFASGRVMGALASGSASRDLTVAMEGAREGLGARLSATGRAADDMRTPAAELSNTGNRTTNVDAAVGLRGARGAISLHAASRRERIEVFEDPAAFPGFSGFQRIGEDRAALKFSAPVRASRLEGSLTWERNRRREYDNARADYVALGLLAKTMTGTVNLHHALSGRVAGTAGLSAMRAGFDKFGKETLVPSSTSDNVGAYVFEQADLGRVKLSAGMRYDWRDLSIGDDAVLKLRAQSRDWGAATGNFGLLYQVREPVALALNVGRGFRAPSNSDLYANGYHEGTRAYERGDPSLGVERSTNVDLALRVQSNAFRGELGVFRNAIADYIYLRPAGAPGRELDTLDHVAGDARLQGIELAAEARPLGWMRLNATADYTRGDNTTTGVPLTFIPPLRATYSARLDGGPRGGYVELGGETHARQARLHPGDIGTGGYTLANAAAGFRARLGANDVAVDLSVRNALDVRYRDFMSQYKTIAHGLGRNVVLRMSTSF